MELGFFLNYSGATGLTLHTTKPDAMELIAGLARG